MRKRHKRGAGGSSSSGGVGGEAVVSSSSGGGGGGGCGTTEEEAEERGGGGKDGFASARARIMTPPAVPQYGLTAASCASCGVRFEFAAPLTPSPPPHTDGTHSFTVRCHACAALNEVGVQPCARSETQPMNPSRPLPSCRRMPNSPNPGQ